MDERLRPVRPEQFSRGSWSPFDEIERLQALVAQYHEVLMDEWNHDWIADAHADGQTDG